MTNSSSNSPFKPVFVAAVRVAGIVCSAGRMMFCGSMLEKCKSEIHPLSRDGPNILRGQLLNQRSKMRNKNKTHDEAKIHANVRQNHLNYLRK